MSVVKRFLAALAIGAVMLSGVPAVAGASSTSTDSEITLTPVEADPETGVVSSPDYRVCRITAYGKTGYTYCDMQPARYNWGRGNIEHFVIGTKFDIYHIWDGAPKWKSLGGEAFHAPNTWLDVTDSPNFRVMTLGLDMNWWCRFRNGGSWSGGWSRCG